MNTIQYTISERTNRLLNLRNQLSAIHTAISEEATDFYGERSVDDILEKYVESQILDLHEFLDKIIMMSICDNTANRDSKEI